MWVGALGEAHDGVQGGMWREEWSAGGDGMGRGKNGVRNHFGRHFTNIVYIIKKMF